MSGQKIIDGLNDAIAFLDGDETRGSFVRVAPLSADELAEMLRKGRYFGRKLTEPQMAAMLVAWRDAHVLAERERCASRAAQWRKSQHVLLHAGEMTAQELRTALAVAGGIEAAILTAI